MMRRPRLKLVLCWHMHQPDYRDALTGDYELPWTYLHALKDYTDMAAHLERHPGMRAVVNLVPSLVEQWLDYAAQSRSGEWRDPLLRHLNSASLEKLDMAQRRQLIQSCLRCYAPKMIDPFPGYRRLRDAWAVVDEAGAEAAAYVSEAFLYDLLVWYHLAWMGETVRKSSPLVQRLMQQGAHFSGADRRQLLALIGELLAGLLPRYKALQQSGQIELATTPASHPLLPLLLDFATAREVVPHLALPQAEGYPGGQQRAREQIQTACDFYQQQFGSLPQGFWPAEGALSTATLELLAAQGLRWTASGEALLANSLRLSWGATQPERSEWLYQPYRFVKKGRPPLLLYFRDDVLSDRVGFEYSRWDGDRAAQDFVGYLEAVLQRAHGRDPVVTVILDGENAWEYYPYNGFYFLDSLYQALSTHPDIEVTTFADLSTRLKPASLPQLTHVVAGSWVYGSLTTWIGDRDKNHAWDLLISAKQAYDTQWPRLSPEAQQRASAQLRVCESSDWFWWFGDYNNADSVQLFDRLYRLNLESLYHLLGLVAPDDLQIPLSHGTRAAEAGGAMRRTAY